jgi:hydroxyacylglutathione hydrolase
VKDHFLAESWNVMPVTLIPCLSDNYAYLIESGGEVAVVDPSEPGPVIAALEAKGLTRLDHILNTHHHFDHTGGNVPLKEKYGAKVTGPRADAHRIAGIDRGVGEGDTVKVGDSLWRVLDIPAHTSGHIALWCPEQAAVFTGDTLFAMGCGRLFEGTPAQMWTSLSKLAALPPETKVYCGHEYTAANGRFALTVDAKNAALKNRMEDVNRLRAEGHPTIPSTMAWERETNPFLRCATQDVAMAAGLSPSDPVAVLAEIRRRKDVFK